MSRCKHQQIVLLAAQDQKLRCRHCHLTIAEKELAEDHCPECYEVYGVKRRDFETVEPESNGRTHYICETCGATITI